MLSKLLSVKPLNDYSIFVQFADGTQGTVSLKHLAHKGVFADWDKNNLFQKAHKIITNINQYYTIFLI